MGGSFVERTMKRAEPEYLLRLRLLWVASLRRLIPAIKKESNLFLAGCLAGFRSRGSKTCQL